MEIIIKIAIKKLMVDLASEDIDKYDALQLMTAAIIAK